MGGFAQRLAAGQEFESDLVAKLTERGNQCAMNGTEHTHPDFVGRLRSDDSEAAKFIRYAPDGVMITKSGEVIHYDAKDARAIEKDAYETYLKYRQSGCRVVVFVKNGGAIYYQDVDKIRFLDSHSYVATFPERMRLPVVDGWITPRASRNQFKRSRMSGTPFKYIDFSSMKRLRDSQ